MSKESSGLLATADRTNMDCWNEFHKLSSQKTTRNPTLFLQLLEKNVAAYQQYASSREIAFHAAKQKCFENSNPSLTPSLIDLLDYSHDASINYLLRLQSEIERLKKLVAAINTASFPDLAFPAPVKTPTSEERERERLLPASTPSLTSRQLLEAISSLQEKMSAKIDAYHAKIEADISFLGRLAMAHPNSSRLVTPLIEELQRSQTWLQELQNHQQSGTERLHQLFEQHLDDLFTETENAARQIQLLSKSDLQEPLAAFSKSRMRLWEATQSFKGLHQEYNPTTDYLETIYGREQMSKRIKEKFSEAVPISR